MNRDIHFMSYASNRQFPYEKSRKRLYEEAIIFDEFKTVKIYNEKDLGKSTIKHLNPIFKHERGGGYMIWKPIVIKRKLDSINDGDFLIYDDYPIKAYFPYLLFCLLILKLLFLV